MSGVSILLAEKCVDKVTKVCNRFIKLRLTINRLIVTFISAYALQAGLTDDQKDQFYVILLKTTSTTNGNFNRHFGQHPHGFQDVHGDYGFGTRNEERTRLLEFCYAITS